MLLRAFVVHRFHAFLPLVTILWSLSLGICFSGCTPGDKVGRTPQNEEAAAQAESEAQQQLAASNFSGAVAPLRELARLRPETPDILNMLGTCVLRSPDRQSFLAAARADLQRDPNDVIALTIASNALTDPNDQKERFTLMRRLVELRGQDDALRLALAQELLNAHFYAEAREHLDILLSHPEKSDGGNAAKALPYYLRGKARFFEATDTASLAAAEADLNESVQRNPKLGWSYLYLGRIYLRRNQAREAKAPLEKSQELLPQSVEPLFELARVHHALGDQAGAAKYEAEFRQRKALEQRAVSQTTRADAFPQDFDLQLQAATTLIEKGDFEKASLYLRRALALRPGDVRARALARRLISIAESSGNAH